jgi:hypothetical protein
MKFSSRARRINKPGEEGMMKAGLCVLVLVLIGGIAGSMWLGNKRDAERQRRAAAELQSQVQALEQELEEKRIRERETASVPPPIIQNTSERRSIESQPAAMPAKAAPTPAVLKDPETRALMRKQQEQGLAKFADKMINAEFARTWNLPEEAAAKAKELFRERAGAGKDLLNTMMFDGLDDDALAQRGRETKQRIDSAETGLRQLLGNEGFDALKEQERAHEDRDRMRRVREELASTAEPLSKEQEEWLVTTFATERKGFSFRVDFGDPSKVDFERVRDHFSEPNLQMHFEDLQQFNARIAERAAQFLSSAQLEQFKTAQNNQLDRARLTVKMTTELFNKRREN